MREKIFLLFSFYCRYFMFGIARLAPAMFYDFIFHFVQFLTEFRSIFFDMPPLFRPDMPVLPCCRCIVGHRSIVARPICLVSFFFSYPHYLPDFAVVKLSVVYVAFHNAPGLMIRLQADD
jgi:hypothetical protein